MDMALVKAHAALDRVVDHAFGAKKALATDSARQEILFTQYTKQTA